METRVDERAQVEKFRRDGVLKIDALVDASVVDELLGLIEPLLASPTRRPGVRRVLEREPRIGEVIERAGVNALMARFAGAGARVVRAIVFDKTPSTNWLVPWHQDPTIAVSERVEAPGFGPWAFKEGEHHCQPPREVLESISTLRIHLDDCGAESGPLRVVRGSHALGLLDDQKMDELARTGEVVEVCTRAGGAAMMKPLSVHSSPKATMPAGRRRVLHLEYSALTLPYGLRWAEGNGA